MAKFMNIYVIRFDNLIPVAHQYAKDYKASHVHVIADSFEKALAACREKYPEAVIKAIERQNHYGGLPLLTVQ